MFDSQRINHRAFSYYQRLGRVKALVEEDCSRPITVTSAARVAGLEKNYFSAFFHAKTGVRFTEWLTYQRVVQAKKLLGDHNYPVTEVAFTVGFQDLRTFERAFKRCFDTTPRAYKRSVRPS